MDTKKSKAVDEQRAAVLLGLPVGELHRIAQMFGLGCVNGAADAEHRLFSYAELRQLCLLAVPAYPSAVGSLRFVRRRS